MSHSNYCPLIWMYTTERVTFWLIPYTKKFYGQLIMTNPLAFQNSYEWDKSTTIHQLHIQKLLMGIYKTMNDMNPTFMKKILSTHESSHNLRASHFEPSRPNTNKYGTDTITFKGSLVWNYLTERCQELYFCAKLSANNWK